MITKEELLAALESSRALPKTNEAFRLALKGLEYEKIEGQEFIPLGEHLLVVGGLTRSRNFWRKKHDDLADELDDKIIALEEKLKDKDASLAVASKIIDDARAKHRDLEIQTAHLKIGRKKAEEQIGVLEDKLRDTVSLKYHDEIVDSANQIIVPLRNECDALEEKLKDKDASLAVASKIINDAQAKHRYLEDRLLDMVGSDHQQIISLRNERNAFQRLVGELEIEKSCIRADLENVCKELSVLKIEIEKCEEAHRAKNAVIDKLLAQHRMPKD